MFLWCFGRRKRSTSSIGEASKTQAPLDTSQLKPKGGEQHECISRNPFLIDLVIEVMLEEADVDTLNTLREMNSFWNNLDLKELEKRALKGHLGELDFSSGCQTKINQFFNSTKAIPQLFHSFKLNFPITFKSIHPLLKKCTPNFLHLEFLKNIKWTEFTTTNLRNFFSWNSQTLEKLVIKRIEDSTIPKQIFIFNIPSANGDSPLVFPNLAKLTWDMGTDGSPWNENIPFQFILDKSGSVDPTPNLTRLELKGINEKFLEMMNIGSNLSRWSKLNCLRILEHIDEDLTKLPSTLLSLGQAGMCLKVFALSIGSPLLDVSPEFWGNWTHFLATQAKSLQVLELNWTCSDNVHDSEQLLLSKIHLPIFESLHTLHFSLAWNVLNFTVEPIESLIIEMGGFRDHFPKVVHMRVNEQGLLNIFPVGGVPISLKSLIIIGVPKNWQVWTSRIRSVESLTCPASFFKVGEAHVLKESIKVFQPTPELKEL